MLRCGSQSGGVSSLSLRGAIEMQTGSDSEQHRIRHPAESDLGVGEEMQMYCVRAYVRVWKHYEVGLRKKRARCCYHCPEVDVIDDVRVVLILSGLVGLKNVRETYDCPVGGTLTEALATGKGEGRRKSARVAELGLIWVCYNNVGDFRRG